MITLLHEVLHEVIRSYFSSSQQKQIVFGTKSSLLFTVLLWTVIR